MHLAELNIAKFKYPTSDPRMADFMLSNNNAYDRLPSPRQSGAVGTRARKGAMAREKRGDAAGMSWRAWLIRDPVKPSIEPSRESPTIISLVRESVSKGE